MHPMGGGYDGLSDSVKLMTDVIDASTIVEENWKSSEMVFWEQMQLDVRSNFRSKSLVLYYRHVDFLGSLII